MKRKEKITRTGDQSTKSEYRSHKARTGSRKLDARWQKLNVDSKEPATSKEHTIATGKEKRENSTVFHINGLISSLSSSVFPSIDKGNPEGKGCVIDSSDEKLAIKACDLFRFFNN